MSFHLKITFSVDFIPILNFHRSDFEKCKDRVKKKLKQSTILCCQFLYDWSELIGSHENYFHVVCKSNLLSKVP